MLKFPSLRFKCQTRLSLHAELVKSILPSSILTSALLPFKSPSFIWYPLVNDRVSIDDIVHRMHERSRTRLKQTKKTNKIKTHENSKG